MKKILLFLFVFVSLLITAQDARYNGWLLNGNGIGTNPFYIGTNDNNSLVFKTNNTSRLVIDGTGVFRIVPVSSSSIIGNRSGTFWYDSISNGLGFAYYQSRYSTGNFMTLTDSVIYGVHRTQRTGAVSDGYLVGTSSNHNLNFCVNMNGGNLPAMSICTVSGGNGGVIINPLTTTYTTDASCRIRTNGGVTYFLNLVDFVGAGQTVFAVASGISGAVLMRNKVAIGSTVTPTANMHVVGDMSVSSTFTNNGLFKSLTTFSVGSTATFASSVVIGASTAANAVLTVIGSGSISSTFTVAGIFKPTGGILGTTTNDNATAGNCGEATNALLAVGSATSLATTVVSNVVSISLTAGDWDVSGNININETTSTVTERVGGVTSTIGTIPVDGSECYNGNLVTLLSGKNTISVPRKRFSLNATTTIYLVVKCTFSAGTEAAYGTIVARRIR